MNAIKPNKSTYLLGYWENGEFWCRGEYTSEDAARKQFALFCHLEPDKHIELIQQITINKGLEYHRPKYKYVYEL